MIRCMMLALMMLLMGNVFGKTIKQSEVYKTPITLQDYIQSYCKKGCVDQEDLLKSVSDTARALDIDFKDLLSIVKVESKFQLKATSKRNKGLMQVNVRWHRDKLKGLNPYNVNVNISVGGKIYKDCLDNNHGNRSKSLRCYNGNGDKKYVSKIKKAREEIDKLIDLDRKGSDEEYLVTMFSPSKKENLMGVTNKCNTGLTLTMNKDMAFRGVVSLKPLRTRIDGFGGDVKGLIVKPYANGEILDENKLPAIDEVRERTYMWAILVLMKDDTTAWLTGGYYNKEEAEAYIQQILVI